MLPSLLQSLRQPDRPETYPCIAEYTHSQRLGRSSAHCLWWPCRNSTSKPSTILLLVPGNPGLVEFYIPYLSHVHQASPDSLAILALSLLGHSSHVAAPSLHFSSLEVQIEGTIEAIDGLDSAFGLDARIVLIGHSVGSWLVFQALRERASRITAAFLLFPTIMHIARTPNGDRISWMFNGYVPRILSALSNVFRVVPKSSLRILFRDWPPEQIDVLWRFLKSPSSVLASLTMAGQEMNIIKDLDSEHFTNVKHKLYFFFAEKDDWIGTNKETILLKMSDESDSARIAYGRHGIPHAYCINHGKELGEQTLQWLENDIYTLSRRR